MKTPLKRELEKNEMKTERSREATWAAITSLLEERWIAKVGMLMLGFLVACVLLVMASDIWETWTWEDKEKKDEERDS